MEWIFESSNLEIISYKLRVTGYKLKSLLLIGEAGTRNAQPATRNSKQIIFGFLNERRNK